MSKTRISQQGATRRHHSLKSWLIIAALAAAAWLALPEDDGPISANSDAGLPDGNSVSKTLGTAEPSSGLTQSANSATERLALNAPYNTDAAPPVRAERKGGEGDPKSDWVADNDSAPDDEPDALESQILSAPSQPAPAGQVPPEVEFARTVARLNVASPAQQLELVDRIWAFGLDLHQEQAALAAIEPLTLAEDSLVAQRARDASENLNSALQSPAITEAWAPELAAETSAYVMELNVRATSDPDPVARRTAITELASHHHPGAVDALATAALDADAENRTEVVASLLRLASSGYEKPRIIAMLETMASQDTPEVAPYASDALETLR